MMQFQMENGILFLPSIYIILIAIVVIYLLVKWSKQLETRRFTVLFYFLISTIITPLYSYSNGDIFYRIWFPLGFIIVSLHLFQNERYHPSKRKASFLGLLFAIIQMFLNTWNTFN